MIKKAITFAIAVVLLSSCLLIYPSAGNEYLHNHIDALTQEEEAELSAMLQELNAGKQNELHIVISTDRNDAFLQYSPSDDLIIFLVEYDTFSEIYYYELFTYGNPSVNITDGEVNRILDDPTVYNSIKGGNVYEGLRSVIPLIKSADEGKLRADGYVGRVILISAIIGICTAAIVSGVIIYKYKKKLKAPIYPIEKYAKMELDTAFCYDRFLYKNVTRVRVNNSSGGRGRVGGGGSRGRR